MDPPQSWLLKPHTKLLLTHFLPTPTPEASSRTASCSVHLQWLDEDHNFRAVASLWKNGVLLYVIHKNNSYYTGQGWWPCHISGLLRNFEHVLAVQWQRLRNFSVGVFNVQRCMAHAQTEGAAMWLFHLHANVRIDLSIPSSNCFDIITATTYTYIKCVCTHNKFLHAITALFVMY